MEYILGAVIVLFVVFFIFDKLIPKKSKENIKVPQNEKLPYKISDNFLTDTERSFYHSLKLYVGDKAVICPKVGLKDIFFISKGIGKDYMKYFAKISQKHVDFLICEKETMKPICGIELDDISHTSKKSYERDMFVEKVYKDAGFNLVRFSSKYSFADFDVALNGIFDKNNEVKIVQTDEEIVLCPKCSIPMVLRKASKGENAGKEFYGCSNYPKCKEIKNIDIH